MTAVESGSLETGGGGGELAVIRFFLIACGFALMEWFSAASPRGPASQQPESYRLQCLDGIKS